MPSAAPRKRHIPTTAVQPTIKSYFTPNNSNTSEPQRARTPERERPLGQLAPLPSSLHSSLLQVGMRVRKSMAQGYKTKTELDKMHMQEQTAQREDKENVDIEVFFGGSNKKNKRGLDEADATNGQEMDMLDFDAMENRKIAVARAPSRGYHQAVLRKGNSDIASKLGGIVKGEDFEEAGFLKPEEEVEMSGL